MQFDIKNMTTSFLPVDFPFSVSLPRKKDNGEDSYYYRIGKETCIAGVFDGCGGSGAKKYPLLRNKSGAFLASRILSGSLRDCFLDGMFQDSEKSITSALKERFLANLSLVSTFESSYESLSSKMAKELPSTAAIICCKPDLQQVRASCYWAGDSRCYLIDNNGLCQLTIDDSTNPDPMDNLTADGRLTNVISLSHDFDIHEKPFTVDYPCILFTATDGCFGYYSTPMEFEYLLLSTLCDADSPCEWERNLGRELLEVSGDDCSLAGFSFGYESFKELKEQMNERKDYLYRHYIEGIYEASAEQKYSRWKCYREKYLRNPQ